MSDSNNIRSIPQPKPLPLFGNIFLIDSNQPILSLMKLSQKYGPIFKLNLIDRESLFISGYEYFNELCDEKRFQKTLGGVLMPLRNGLTGNGLLTSFTYEPIWRKAHNILMPCFSKRAMERYFDGMLATTQQLIKKWQQINEAIDVSNDMISLALDTIGICGFDYQFNLLSENKKDPFIDAFSWVFKTSMNQVLEFPFAQRFKILRNIKFQRKMEFINKTVDTIIQKRRALGAQTEARSDMLSYMLWGIDEETGEKLDDVNIRQQVITFLTIGHDTAAGLLSFMLYALVKYPAVLKKANEEVDRVLGTDLKKKPSFDDIKNLHYLHQVLKETLRLWPVYPALLLEPIHDTVLANKYKITTKNKILVLLAQLHRDPAIWGDNAEVFNPENFSLEAEAARPANAYKPFGIGMRACIAREFAVQEVLLSIAMILKNFNLIDADPDYKLVIKEVNIFKPDNFKIKVTPK
jgi:cytochrome P450/NADPH-cytochrome P450 reductase